MVPLRLLIPAVLGEPEPIRKSPCCRTGVDHHQRSHRGLTDIRLGGVDILPYKCKRCGKTFTVSSPW